MVHQERKGKLYEMDSGFGARSLDWEKEEGKGKGKGKAKDREKNGKRLNDCRTMEDPVRKSF